MQRPALTQHVRGQEKEKARDKERRAHKEELAAAAAATARLEAQLEEEKAAHDATRTALEEERAKVVSEEGVLALASALGLDEEQELATSQLEQYAGLFDGDEPQHDHEHEEQEDEQEDEHEDEQEYEEQEYAELQVECPEGV